MDTKTEANIREQAREDGITHISTGVAVLRNNKILVVRRAAGDFLGGYFELPGGGVDQKENISDSATREVKEETGLTVSKVIGVFEGFDYSTDKKPRVRQVNFLVEVEQGEVKLNPDEHDEFIWVSRNDLPDIKFPENMLVCMNRAFDLAGFYNK